jgi:hypothetical protein
MTAWEVYSFGRTVYMVYTDADRIKETLQAFYKDNELIQFIACLTPEECAKLADQLGEVLGSLVANRKEIKSGLQNVKKFLNDFKYKRRKLAVQTDEIKDKFVEESGGASKSVPDLPEGSFSISDWSGYPEGLPKPEGPFRLIEGSEYDAARKAAN